MEVGWGREFERLGGERGEVSFSYFELPVYEGVPLISLYGRGSSNGEGSGVNILVLTCPPALAGKVSGGLIVRAEW